MLWQILLCTKCTLTTCDTAYLSVPDHYHANKDNVDVSSQRLIVVDFINLKWNQQHQSLIRVNACGASDRGCVLISNLQNKYFVFDSNHLLKLLWWWSVLKHSFHTLSWSIPASCHLNQGVFLFLCFTTYLESWRNMLLIHWQPSKP